MARPPFPTTLRQFQLEFASELIPQAGIRLTHYPSARRAIGTAPNGRREIIVQDDRWPGFAQNTL